MSTVPGNCNPGEVDCPHVLGPSWLALNFGSLFSYANKPTAGYVEKNKVVAKASGVTAQSSEIHWFYGKDGALYRCSAASCVDHSNVLSEQSKSDFVGAFPYAGGMAFVRMIGSKAELAYLPEAKASDKAASYQTVAVNFDGVVHSAMYSGKHGIVLVGGSGDGTAFRAMTFKK